ncbi:MAG TPA: DUF2807 domain-containing protein [Candidatus Limnocylindrales bacterium]|nr:DUF2807 domain-containing protein [Candidatus Limnocylindrales bacterium]
MTTRTESPMPARASHARTRLVAALAAAAILLPTLAACGDAPIEPEPTPVTGAGELVVEDRTDGPVERISVGADVTVLMKTGDATNVLVRGEPNVVPLVVTETVDGQLIVNVPIPGYVTQQRVVIEVTTPTIESVSMSAGATGSLELVAEVLNLDLSGEAEIIGVGRVDALTLTASSSAVIDFTAMTVGNATVNLSEGAEATLIVEGDLTGQASGGATIQLPEAPASVAVETTSGASMQGAGAPPEEGAPPAG